MFWKLGEYPEEMPPLVCLVLVLSPRHLCLAMAERGCWARWSPCVCSAKWSGPASGPLSSQGQDATGGLYLHCLGLAPLQHICHGAGWLGGDSWSAPKKSQGMIQNCTPKRRVGCLSTPPGVLLWSCAVMLRIIFLGSSRFRKQFIQGSNPTGRHWIPRYNAWLKKSPLGDCTIATCLPHWHRLPQPSLLPGVRETIWAEVVVFPDEVLL